MDAGIVIVAAMLDQFGAQRTHGGDLVRIVDGRHDQHTANAEATAGIGQRLAVIACGAGNDAAPLLLLGEPGHQVEAAAHLEGGGRQVVLVLEIVAAAQQLRQGGPFPYRGVGRMWRCTTSAAATTSS